MMSARLPWLIKAQAFMMAVALFLLLDMATADIPSMPLAIMIARLMFLKSSILTKKTTKMDMSMKSMRQKRNQLPLLVLIFVEQMR